MKKKKKKKKPAFCCCKRDRDDRKAGKEGRTAGGEKAFDGNLLSLLF